MTSGSAQRNSLVVVTGGGSGSELMRRILSAVYEVPVRTPLVRDAAGMGAAVCAAVGVGMHPGWTQATSALVRMGEPLVAGPDDIRTYREIRQRYARVLPRLRAVLADVL